VIDAQGNVLIAIADGCTGACADGTGAANFTDDGVLVVQTSGPPLYDPSIVDVVPGLAVSPATLDFGNQKVRSTSAPKVVTVTNNTGKTVKFTSKSVTAPYTQDNTCGKNLAPGASCTFTITFRPTAAAPFPGALTIIGNDADSPHQVVLSGTGVDKAAAATLSRSAIAFGTHAVKSTTVETVTLTSTGDKVLQIRHIGDTFANFRTTHDCPDKLAPGASCTITVKFKPEAAGGWTGLADIVTNAPTSPDHVELTGTGN
jgi:hypothetical protein